MSSNGSSNKSHKSRYVALGAVSALSLLALGGQTISANSVVVKPGDTVWGIANQYATTTSALENANPTNIKKLNNSIDLIQAGQSLVLPNTSNTKAAQASDQDVTYVVKSGDTLSAIAKKFGVTVNQLMAWNHLTNADRIQVGQVLVVSGDPNASVPATSTIASATASPAPATVTPASAVTPTTDTTTTTTTAQTSVQPSAPVYIQPARQEAETTASQSQNTQTGQLSTNNTTETANTRAVYAAYTNTSYQPVSQATTTQTSATAAQPATSNTTNLQASQQVTSQATTQTTTQQTSVVDNNTAANSNVASDNGQVAVANQSSQATNTQASQTSQASSQAVTSSVAVQSSASQPVVSSAASNQTSVASQATSQTTQATQNTQNQSNQGGVIFVDNNQTTPNQSSNTGSVVSLAVKLANSNIPYVWGGNSLSGMDCSGLVDYVYLHATGKQLPHYTVALESCVNQKPVSQATAGDLLFWGQHGATYHTAIYIGNNQYVAAPKPGENVQVQTISQYFMPSFAGTVK